MAKLFSPPSLLGESPSPGSSALARTRNVIRRNKWRLRPLKRFVLPMRNSKKQVMALLRTLTPGHEAPSSIEHSTIVYVQHHRWNTLTEVHPSEKVESLPHPFENRNGDDARTSDPAYVFRLRQVDFWARYGGCIVTADKRLLGDLSPEVWGVENHAIFSQLRLPEIEQLAGCTAVAVTPEVVGNYYHWLVDLLPRLLLLKGQCAGFDSFERILLNGSGASYERESLAAAGVPRSRIRYVDERHRFRLDLAVLASMDHSNPVLAPWKTRALHELRDSLSRDCRSYGGRVYVSRRGAAVRRVVNEEKLRPILERAGFAVVELESLSWAEQVKMFANAEVVIAPHGAALANIAFCDPETVVAEISTRAGYRDFYRRLSASGSLEYRAIEARPRVAAAGATFRAMENEDMIVDESALTRFLDDL